LKTLQQRIQDYEQKVVLLSNEIERLNKAYQSKVEEIENLKRTISHMENDLSKSQVVQDEVKRLGNLLQQKQQEIDEWRNKFYKLDAQFNEYRLYEQRVKEYESRARALQEEISRLNINLKGVLEELERWK